MRVTIACLLLPVLSLAAPANEDRPKKELAALQGTWRLAATEKDGKTRDVSDQPLEWVIKGNKVLWGGEDLAELTVDGATTPWSIDVTFLDPRKVNEGVCSVEGDTLKICINGQAEGVKERPVGFATEGKPGLQLLTLKRVKPGDEIGKAGLPGYVGVALRTTEEPKQVVVADVLEGSPARKAGLKKDDVILMVGGAEATDLRTVVDLCRQSKPGSKLTLRIKRDGKEQDVAMVVGVLPFRFLN
jgi:uncharacterized protein (TIGR03067 family)